MDGVYFALVALSAAAAAGFLFLRLKKRGERGVTALMALLLGAVMGFACGKITYCLLLAHIVFPQWGFGALIRMKAGEFSFFGAMLGASLGTVLAGKTAGIRTGKMLDAWAPCLCLLTAALRLMEYRLGMLGMGDEMEAEALCFFPLAITDEWGDWYLAVFALEAFCALIVLGIMLGREKKDAFPVGLPFRRTVFYLVLPQILLESLRVECLRWGFVKVEQVLCTGCVMILIALACRERKSEGARKYAPVAAALVCVGGMIAVEFALDKFNPSTLLCYGAMALMLVILAVIEIRCVKNKKQAAAA